MAFTSGGREIRFIEHTPKGWSKFLKTNRPISESIVPLEPGGRRKWRALNDEELVSYAQCFVNMHGLRRRIELRRADEGLLSSLDDRGLIGRIDFEDRRRDWKSRSDEEILAMVKEFVERNDIKSKMDLKKADQGMHQILCVRGILEKVGLAGSIRSWASVDNSEIIEIAKELIEERGIEGRKELGEADMGLYLILLKRGLIDEVGLKVKTRERRNWTEMSDGEIIGVAKRFVECEGILGRTALKKADSGLYGVLRSRGLLESVGFPMKRRIRKWKRLSDTELIGMAKKFCKKTGITRKVDLHMSDAGLYDALRKRNLLDSIGLEKVDSIRNWGSMSDDILLGFAWENIFWSGIRSVYGQQGLAMQDSGLFGALKRRKLLEAVFSRFEREIEANGLSEISDALSEFSDD